MINAKCQSKEQWAIFRKLSFDDWVANWVATELPIWSNGAIRANCWSNNNISLFVASTLKTNKRKDCYMQWNPRNKQRARYLLCSRSHHMSIVSLFVYLNSKQKRDRVQIGTKRIRMHASHLVNLYYKICKSLRFLCNRKPKSKSNNNKKHYYWARFPKLTRN